MQSRLFVFSIFVISFTCDFFILFSSVIPSPFSIFKNDESLQNEDKFFKLKPSEESNGCFLAVLKRDVSCSKQPRLKNDHICR